MSENPIKHICLNTQLVVGTEKGEMVNIPTETATSARESLNDGLIRLTAGQRWPTIEAWRKELRIKTELCGPFGRVMQ